MALVEFERARLLDTQINDTEGQLSSLVGIAEAQLRLGQVPEAETTLREIVDLSSSVGNWVTVARAKVDLGRLLLSQGDSAGYGYLCDGVTVLRDHDSTDELTAAEAMLNGHSCPAR